MISFETSPGTGDRYVGGFEHRAKDREIEMQFFSIVLEYVRFFDLESIVF